MSNANEVASPVERLVMHRPGTVGCHDHNCLFQDNSRGMHTNGGCQCERALMRTPEGRKASLTIRYLQSRIADALEGPDA